MEKWEKQYKEDRYKNQRERENPSFSSTLLDAIYRSIDESNGDEAEEELIFYRDTMRRKHGDSHTNGYKDHELGKKKKKEEEIVSLKRACMIERWMEEKKVVSYEKVAVRRKSMEADFNKKGHHQKEFDSVLLNSSSTSSESSCGGSGFSSSESESIYGRNSSAKPVRPKPIRTGFSSWPNLDQEMDVYRRNSGGGGGGAEKPKKSDQGNYNSFVKTKSKALKIYGDLKKVKQPISPGGKLATFLNSLFTAGHAKKPKISSKSDNQLQEESITPCSSASSFSRSCLSKTPSSRGKLSSNGAKRSVRFYPVSVIVDEDCRPCGHKTLYGNQEAASARNVVLDPTNEELKLHVMDQNRRVEEVARDLLKKYHKKKKDQDFDMGDSRNGNGVCSEVKHELNYDDDDDDDDDDDIASCASSDLFELDNLSAIGIDHKYSEELPVYETTHLGTNLAIANGLIM